MELIQLYNDHANSVSSVTKMYRWQLLKCTLTFTCTVFPFQQHLPQNVRHVNSLQSFVDNLLMNDDVHLFFVQFKFNPMKL